MTSPSVREAAPGKLRDRLRRNRAQLEAELADPARRRFLSPLLYGLYRELAPRLRRYSHGRMLDAGCGTMPYRSLVLGQVDQYVGFDIERRTDGVEYVGDIEDLEPVPSGSVDVILCSEVLEHVSHPPAALRACHRVLKPGGTLIVTTPFLARLHEEPYDFFRYTEHGLRTLFTDAGFEIEDMASTGSLLSFLGHQAATMLVIPIWHVKGLKTVAFSAVSWLITRPCSWVDRRLPGRRVLPLGYVTIGRRLP